MKAKRHEWSPSVITQHCRNHGCNWLRTQRDRMGAATATHMYRRTDEPESYLREMEKVPPCEGDKT